MKMKQMLATAALLAVSSLCAYADDTPYAYPYLVMTTSGGERATLAVDELVITFSDGKLVAKNASGIQSFNLTDLAKMNFATSGDVADGIERMNADELKTKDAEIYDLSGRKMLNANDGNQKLESGVYVVKQNGRTFKMYVK